MKRHVVARMLAAALLCSAALSAVAANAFVSLLGPGGSVSRFGTSGGTPAGTFSIASGAVDMLLMPDENQMLLGTTNLSQGEVRGGSPSLIVVADSRNGSFLSGHPTPGSVVGMVRDAAGRHVYATGLAADGSVLVMSVDLQTNAVASAAVPGAAAFQPYPIAISADGASLFVPTVHAIVVFKAATLAASGVIALPSNGIAAPPLATPDGTTLLATGNGSVYVIDIASRSLIKKIAIETPAAASGDALSPDGKTYYVSAGTLSAIDVASRTVLAAAPLGQTSPYRLGISPDGHTLYATELANATTLVVDSATLATQRTLHSLAPPYAIAVKSNGDVLALDANSTYVYRIDTTAQVPVSAFRAGDRPGPGVMAAGKLFVPETANVAVHRKADREKAARPIAVNLLSELSIAAIGNKVYVNSGSLVRIIDARSEATTGSFTVRVPGCSDGDLCTALETAASGDGRSLLASYLHIAAGGGTPLAGGIVKIDAVTGTQKRISSFPFLPVSIASNRTGTSAYGIGYNAPNQVGRWDTTNDRFMTSVTLPGNPVYSALATDAAGSVLYLVDSNGKIDLLDATTLQLLGSIAIGGHPSGIAISADGTQALVTDQASDTVALLDLTTASVAGTIELEAPVSGAVFID